MKNATTLMIIDDDKSDRFFFRDAVNEINPLNICLEASNGESAIQQLSNAFKLPDYIFLDLNMPLMDGRSCLAELKNNIRLKDIPVIIYSGVISDQSVKELTLLGAASFMIKQMELNRLPGDIVSCIENSEEKILGLWKRKFNWKNPFSFTLCSLKSLKSVSLEEMFPVMNETYCQLAFK